MGGAESGQPFLDIRSVVCAFHTGDFENKMTLEQKIKGRRIGIMGMARSGVAAAQLAKQLEGIPFVSDSAAETKLVEATGVLRKNGIAFETNGHTDKLLQSDFLVVSPGVPGTISIIREAEKKGIPLFSEIEMASWVCQGSICAITGSNGKTTTTTLIGEVINAGGIRAEVCGNIGKPFAEVASQLSAEDVAVVEVSSYQLRS